MSRWSEFLDGQVERQRARRDPLARLPWWVVLAIAVGIVALGLVQLVLGTGASKVIGLALLVLVAPSQLVAAWAMWRVQKEQ